MTKLTIVDENENYESAARHEALEELGIVVDGLDATGKFYIERKTLGGLARRFQTVFMCTFSGPIQFNQSEISEVKWVSMEEVDDWLISSPDEFIKNFSKAFSLLKKVLTP